MSSVLQPSVLSVADYLSGEETSQVKHEYVAGEVFAMAGAGEAHVTIAGNLFALLRAHVRGGPCRVYISDMKLRVERDDAFFYPDVFVTCHPADAAETRFKRYPTLLVEVLSPSTAAFDRGGKFGHYRHIDGLKEYVLIESEAMTVDVFRRGPDGHWVLFPFSGDELVEIESLDFRCPMAALFEDVLLASAGD
jgi:Uma2 family endonuclease